jgi:hypothetical protein
VVTFAREQLGEDYAYLGGLFGGWNCTGLLEGSWDEVGRDNSGQSAAAGVYLYRFESGRSVQTRTMTLVK